MQKLLTYLFLFLFTGSLCANEASKKIAAAIKSGDVKELCTYFNSTIELTVMDKEDFYSKSQAEIILKKFFDEHKVKTFELAHKGGNGKTQYFIGNFNTDKKKFRIYFLLKKTGDKDLIHVFRIDNVSQSE